MANIQKRLSPKGKTTYRVQVRLKGFPGQTASFTRLTDAKKWAQVTEAAIREGRHFKTAESKRHTMNQLIDRYINEVLPRKGSGKAQQDIQSHQLLWWKDVIGDYSLAETSSPLLAEYRDKLLNTPLRNGKQRSNAIVNRYLAALSHAFTIAVREWQWLEENPLRKVQRLKEPRGRVRFLSDEERERLLAACRQSTNPYLYTLVVLALSTGARYGELTKLTWNDVSLKEQKITLHHTKNGERRVLPLMGYALECMCEHSKIRRLDTTLVFPSKKGNTPARIRSAWEKVLLEAEIEDFRFHDLRHSAASYLAMNGASLAEIAEVLGHKTLQMVKRYAHLSEAHTSKVVAAMNERIFG